jgi:cyclic pyranopterin phosphate synthase
VGLDEVDIVFSFADERASRIVCAALVRSRTGMEMAAIVGVTDAAITLYDVCSEGERGGVLDHLGFLKTQEGGRETWGLGLEVGRGEGVSRRR